MLSRRERVLRDEYRELREDERNWISRVITLSSLYVVIAGTTVFFLLGNGAGTRHVAPRYEDWVYILIPIPSFSAIAITIQNAITATARGRLMLAYERALARDMVHITLPLGERIPAGASFHAQLRWIHDTPGSILSFLLFLPLFFVIAICYLAGSAIHSCYGTAFFVVFYAAITITLLVIGRDGFISPGPNGFARLESQIADSARSLTEPRRGGS